MSDSTMSTQKRPAATMYWHRPDKSRPQDRFKRQSGIGARKNALSSYRANRTARLEAMREYNRTHREQCTAATK